MNRRRGGDGPRQDHGTDNNTRGEEGSAQPPTTPPLSVVGPLHSVVTVEKTPEGPTPRPTPSEVGPLLPCVVVTGRRLEDLYFGSLPQIYNRDGRVRGLSPTFFVPTSRTAGRRGLEVNRTVSTYHPTHLHPTSFYPTHLHPTSFHLAPKGV